MSRTERSEQAACKRSIQFRAGFNAILGRHLPIGRIFSSWLMRSGPPSPQPSPPGEGARYSRRNDSSSRPRSTALRTRKKPSLHPEHGRAPSPGGEGWGEGERLPTTMSRCVQILPAGFLWRPFACLAGTPFGPKSSSWIGRERTQRTHRGNFYARTHSPAHFPPGG